jgi:hypothetical protein
MRTGRKIMLLSGLTLFLVAPLSILITILLVPLWRWLEAATGIESIGHSGPALWCYGVVFAASSALGAGSIIREARRPRAAARS